MTWKPRVVGVAPHPDTFAGVLEVGGDPTPSRDDRDLTRVLCETGALLDIPVLDHIIIARGGHTSFKDEGWL